MSNVIAFLEAMGHDTALRHADPQSLQATMTQRQIDLPTQLAILGRDSRALESLVGATPVVCCVLFPEKEDEDKDEPDQKDEQEIRSASHVLCDA